MRATLEQGSPEQWRARGQALAGEIRERQEARDDAVRRHRDAETACRDLEASADIATLDAEREALVWANDLAGGEPAAGLEVAFFDRNGAALGSAATDGAPRSGRGVTTTVDGGFGQRPAGRSRSSAKARKSVLPGWSVRAAWTSL